MAFVSVLFGWLHVMFAVLVVGGGFFNLFLLLPVLRTLDPQTAGQISLNVAKKFTILVWVSIAGLLATGLVRVALDSSFERAFGFDNPYGVTMNIKVILFIAIIVHAFLITRTGRKIPTASSPEERALLQQRIFRFSLINTILAFVVIFLAVGLRYGGSVF